MTGEIIPVKEQITEFLKKCEEIKNCKFIMATTRIKDLLKAIVNSSELYVLFNTVATNFDYNAAKRRCFVDGDANIYGSCRIILPDTVGDRLAFIFCLFVEFDRNDINFNAFLQKYYPKDGSYYASYHLFCDEVIGSLEAIIADIYSKELSEPDPVGQITAGEPVPQIAPVSQSAEPQPAAQTTQPDAGAAAAINTICLIIESEKESLTSSSLGDEDKEAGLEMLNALISAVRAVNVTDIKALTCGYNYFVLYTGFMSSGVEMMFNEIGGFIGTL